MHVGFAAMQSSQRQLYTLLMQPCALRRDVLKQLIDDRA